MLTERRYSALSAFVLQGGIIVCSMQGNQLCPNLTEQELNVLRLIGRGLTNAQISHTICASETTIKYHCTNIFRKFGVRNRVQVISKSLSLGILTFEELVDA